MLSDGGTQRAAVFQAGFRDYIGYPFVAAEIEVRLGGIGAARLASVEQFVPKTNDPAAEHGFPQLPKVLLQISTEKLEPGTVVESFVPKSATLASYNPSLLVTATDGGTRQVTYDINTGWNWGDYSWAQIIPASADLAKVLIERE